MRIDKKRYCLVLSKGFRPNRVVGAMAAMKYLVSGKGKAYDTETYQLYDFEEWIDKSNSQSEETTVRTEKLWIEIPEIIVMRSEHIFKSHKNRSLSRKKVYQRDGQKCRYCNCTLNTKNRTIDHIHPVSKGGDKFSYKNVVASCFDCNSTKSDKLLSELKLHGPDKKNNLGQVIMRKEERWDLKGPVTNPSESVLYHVPKCHILDSWLPYLN